MRASTVPANGFALPPLLIRLHAAATLIACCGVFKSRRAPASILKPSVLRSFASVHSEKDRFIMLLSRDTPIRAYVYPCVSIFRLSTPRSLRELEKATSDKEEVVVRERQFYD